jgi:hypothetical protein
MSGADYVPPGAIRYFPNALARFERFALVDVACWPEAGDPGCPLYRRYQGNSGSDVEIAKPTRLTATDFA